MNGVIIRTATVEDAEAICGIYAYYVENTAVSFEYDTPSVQEMQRRIAAVSEKYPYLVAEKQGKIIGYAYANTYRTRRAYSHCVELSLYLDKDERGNGYGRLLYDALNRQLKALGYKNIYACVTYTEAEDEYLTHASLHFHEREGFTPCGTFHQCGYKFNRWYDTVWMEKFL